MQVIAILTVPDDMHPDDALFALRLGCNDLECELRKSAGHSTRITLFPLPSVPVSIDAVILPRALSISDLIVHSLKAISGG